MHIAKAMMDLLSKDVNGAIITNSAAIGYMIMAATEIGIDKETILQIEANMKYFIDLKTYKQAIETYNNFI